MIISKEKPPIYEKIRAAFGDVWERGVIITYGDRAYTARGGMSLDLQEHEAVHIKQQAAFPGGADAWWDKFIADKEFRLSQELEAYKVQVAYIRKHVSNRRKRETMIPFIYSSMADNYAGMITREEAERLLA